MAPLMISPGWRLVPITPTAEMQDAGRDANDKYATEIAPCSAFRACDAWAAMLAASPPSPEVGDETVERMARAFGRAYFRNWDGYSETSDIPQVIAAVRVALAALDDGALAPRAEADDATGAEGDRREDHHE